MTELPAPNSRGGAGRCCAKAIPANARSTFAAFNDNEHRTAHPSRGKAAGADAHSHVRCGHGLSHVVRVRDQLPSGSSDLFDVPSCELAPVSAGVPFTRIQIAGVLPRRNSRVRAVMAAPRVFHSRVIGLQSLTPHSNSHLLKLIRQDRSEQFHFQSCPSQKTRLAGFKNASERGQKIGNSGQVGAA